jgi:carbamoyl-phosphate synthase large subunit
MEGTVFLSVADRDKVELVEVARRFVELGFRIRATEGTRTFLAAAGIESERVFKIHEHGRPDVADEIKNRAIDLIINTPAGKASQFDDTYIRKAAIKYRVPYVTTLAAARASAQGIAAARAGRAGVKSLQGYHLEMGGAAG